MHKTPSNSGFVSLFDRVHDVVVVGSGLIGFAAVRSLFASGKTVAWLNPTGEILWEISRALENDIGDCDEHPKWRDWLNENLSSREGIREQWLEGAIAEAAAAKEIQAWRGRVSFLLHAMPVAVEIEGGRLVAATIATKAGARRVCGRRWMDTTEKGLLASLTTSEETPGRSAQNFDTLVFQSLEWEARGAEILTFCETHPFLRFVGSARKSEWRFRVQRPEFEQGDFALLVPGLVREFHAAVPGGKFLLSHCSSMAYPVYPDAAEGAGSIMVPPNLLVASPVWTGGRVVSLADRFGFGIRAAANIASLPDGEPVLVSANPELPKARTEVKSEIVVAGAGTAGAVAALAAARRGHSTIALELAPFAGGIGAGAGISTYWHGLSGGLQDEIDCLTNELSALFGGIVSPTTWHHEARKIALATLFRDAEARFQGETLLCGAEQDGEGRITSLLAASGGSLTRFVATAFIDSTGDGDLCALAGVPFSMGRPGDSRTLCYSQAAYFIKEVDGVFNIGIISYDAGWVDPTDPEDLTRARLEGLAHHLHDDWPSEDKPFILSPLLGIRQSRQVTTDVRLELADLIDSARFEDAVGEAAAHVDNHSSDFEFESDEVLFYLWVCRGFNHPLRVELPYRMLLPQGLRNTWVACRAAGISSDASYCVRMQRDMQRLGEVAGTAASLCVQAHCESRDVDVKKMQPLLRESGAMSPPGIVVAPAVVNLLDCLDRGENGLFLWHLARDPASVESVVERLVAPSEAVSFYAAAVLAFQADTRAESRLLRALENRETGLDENDAANKGAYDLCVAIPFWLQAIVLLRMCGTEACLPALLAVLEKPLPFNVITMIALTVERLVQRGISSGPVFPLLKAMQSSGSGKESFLSPTRSLWKTLGGDEFSNATSWGVDTRQDHLWQLHLVLGRTYRHLNLSHPDWIRAYASDQRAFVRTAFNELLKQ